MKQIYIFEALLRKNVAGKKARFEVAVDTVFGWFGGGDGGTSFKRDRKLLLMKQRRSELKLAAIPMLSSHCRIAAFFVKNI
jgi:hypothetical protein